MSLATQIKQHISGRVLQRIVWMMSILILSFHLGEHVFGEYSYFIFNASFIIILFNWGVSAIIQQKVSAGLLLTKKAIIYGLGYGLLIAFLLWGILELLLHMAIDIRIPIEWAHLLILFVASNILVSTMDGLAIANKMII